MNSEALQIVELAISEDVGGGDVTSALLENKLIDAEIVCR